MAFPVGWPPRPSPGALNIAFFVEGNASADYSDNAYLFIDGVGANPFQPTPYVPPGGEEVVTPITSIGPGTPLGTGRDARDAVPFNPNVFFRGSGLGTSKTTLVVAVGLVTYTDLTKKFHQGMVAKEMRIGGSTSAGNDGDFVIKEVLSDHVVTWENATGVTEDFPLAGSFRMRVIDESPPKAAIWSSTIRITNEGSDDMYVTFNGTDDHGKIPANSAVIYRSRAEAGMAVRSDSGTPAFFIEAW
jgi:hypothetical protein